MLQKEPYGQSYQLQKKKKTQFKKGTFGEGAKLAEE